MFPRIYELICIYFYMRILLYAWSFIVELVKEPGGLLVLFGVFGEIVFEYCEFPKSEEQRRRLRRTFGLILILGLTVCAFRSNRTLVPIHIGHRFRWISDSSRSE